MGFRALANRCLDVLSHAHRAILDRLLSLSTDTPRRQPLEREIRHELTCGTNQGPQSPRTASCHDELGRLVDHSAGFADGPIHRRGGSIASSPEWNSSSASCAYTLATSGAQSP